MRTKIQDSRFRMQDQCDGWDGCDVRIQDSGFRIGAMDAMHAIRDARSAIRDTRYGMGTKIQDSGCRLSAINAMGAIRDSGYGLRNSEGYVRTGA